MLKFDIQYPLPSQLITFTPDLKDMSTEKWKFLPGFDDNFMILNLGRVKSLRIIMDGSKKRWSPEKIISIFVISKIKNAEKKSPSIGIACFSYKENSVTLYITRWVYIVFVEEFSIRDSSMCVHYKDLDPLNLTYGNWVIESSYKSFGFDNLNH